MANYKIEFDSSGAVIAKLTFKGVEYSNATIILCNSVFTKGNPIKSQVEKALLTEEGENDAEILELIEDLESDLCFAQDIIMQLSAFE